MCKKQRKICIDKEKNNDIIIKNIMYVKFKRNKI